MREMEQEKKYVFHLLRLFLSNRHFNGIVVASLCSHFTITKITGEFIQKICYDQSQVEEIVLSKPEALILRSLLERFEHSKNDLLNCNVSLEVH
tara:strand:+ start:623 stop:904 length:282 start_codon:yes stop_codon:yes gene_type:complete